MKKILAALLLFVGTFAFAQNSSIIATVTDSDGQTWNNGNYQLIFVPPSGYTGSAYTFNGSPWTPPTPINGFMNSSGVLTFSPLPRNDYILPSGSGWAIRVCPVASAPCSTTTLVINQASQNLSSSLVVVAPRFAASNVVLGSFGYSDSEILPAAPPIGNFYWNVTSGQQRYWNGSAWQSSGLSSVSWGQIVGTLSNQIDLQTALNAKAPIASPAFTGTPTAPTKSCASNTDIATGAYVAACAPSPLPTNAFGALNNDGSGTLAWVPPFAVDVTQAPYGAKCDGSTDDSAAIQAALDANAGIFIPPAPDGSQTQCEIPEGVTLCSSNNHFGFNAIFGNGQVLDYTPTTGTAITITCGTGGTGGAILDGVNIEMDATSGTPITLLISNSAGVTVKNSNDYINTVNSGKYNSVVISGSSWVLFYTGTWAGGLFMDTAINVEIQNSFFNGLDLNNVQMSAIESTSFGVSALPFTITNSISTSLQADDFVDTVPLTITSPTQVSFNGVASSGSIIFAGSGTNVASGDIQFSTTGPPPITGSFTGALATTDGDGVQYLYQNGFLYSGLLYSVAGTPIPTCNSGLLLERTSVSDATALSGLYVGSGSFRAPVYCGFDGTSYAWKMYAPTAASGGIDQLTGDVTAGPGTGSQVATLAASGVTAGNYTNANLTVNAKGIVTAASNGSGGSGWNGINAQSSSYTALSSDALKLINYTGCSSSPSVTLPATSPSSTWKTYVADNCIYPVTILGVMLNGVLTNVQITPGMQTSITTDGSNNYFASGAAILTGSNVVPAFVQSTGLVYPGVATFTYPNPVSPHSALILALQHSDTGPGVITDNWGDTFNFVSGQAGSAQWAVACNAHGGTTTISLSQPYTTNIGYEFSNTALTSCVDASNSGRTTSLATVSTGSITTTVPNDLIFVTGFFRGGTGATTMSEVNGYTALDAGWTPYLLSAATWYGIQKPTATISDTINSTSSDVSDFDSSIIAIKPAGAVNLQIGDTIVVQPNLTLGSIPAGPNLDVYMSNGPGAMGSYHVVNDGLAAVNSNTGPCGDSTHVLSSYTVTAQGLTTACYACCNYRR